MLVSNESELIQHERAGIWHTSLFLAGRDPVRGLLLLEVLVQQPEGSNRRAALVRQEGIRNPVRLRELRQSSNVVIADGEKCPTCLLERRQGFLQLHELHFAVRWSWDITKLLGPTKWTYFHLYVIIDIFSRYVPGWLLAHRESAALAERLLGETMHKHNILADQLTIHADRGTSMASKPVALLLADLGVTKSHSRPHCSNDNPYSEAQFKTLKYRPEFPERFGSIEDGRAFCQRFFRWYNHEHHHSGLGFHTPADVHFGRAPLIQFERARVLEAAYAAHPERFVRQLPLPPPLPGPAWINQPQKVPPAQ